MSEYQYECFYCGAIWGGVYRVNDPECRKCGSEGDYYVKTRKIDRNDVYGYSVEEGKNGNQEKKKSGSEGHGPDDGERILNEASGYLFID